MIEHMYLNKDSVDTESVALAECQVLTSLSDYDCRGEKLTVTKYY